MTQSSLIARLREYETALEAARDLVPPISATARYFDATLTDLRDLIREAEGQRCRWFSLEESPLFDDGILEELAKPIEGCVTLYPALGEKP